LRLDWSKKREKENTKKRKKILESWEEKKHGINFSFVSRTSYRTCQK
jgi:hypothetical protein